MANNRLYIEDTENGDIIMVAKSFGDGWSWRADADAINSWLNALNFGPRDMGASFGRSPSCLRFVTENEVNNAKP
jgi:hypothetical protein